MSHLFVRVDTTNIYSVSFFLLIPVVLKYIIPTFRTAMQGGCTYVVHFTRGLELFCIWYPSMTVHILSGVGAKMTYLQFNAKLPTN